MEKILFALDIEDGWPPVGAEGVWCEKVGDNYQLKNVPFFIPGLAREDIFKAQIDPVNEHVFEFEIIKESGHSVVWLMNNIDLDLTGFIKKLTTLGCCYEGFPRFSMASIDIPPSVNIDAVNDLLDEYEQAGIDFAFPVWRFD